MLKPFLETTTFATFPTNRVAVVNLTDDVMLFAQAAISEPAATLAFPAEVVRGVVLEAACSWREVEVDFGGRHPAALADRDPGGAPGVPTGSSSGSTGPGTPCSRRRSSPPAPTCSPPSRFSEELREAPDHRGQDRRPPRAGGDGAADGRMSAPDSVFVEAAARLHFGVLDLRGRARPSVRGPGRGDIRTLAAARGAARIGSHGAGAGLRPGDRSSPAGSWRFHGLDGGADLVVHRCIPAHSGLGSGTQLGLAVARALAELSRSRRPRPVLARAVERGRRSAIGTWTFALGGFIVEGGRRRTGAEEIAPLLARYRGPRAAGAASSPFLRAIRD